MSNLNLLHLQIFRSDFLLECRINNDGSWKVEVLGCQAPSGKFIAPGENHTEENVVPLFTLLAIFFITGSLFSLFSFPIQNVLENKIFEDFY